MKFNKVKKNYIVHIQVLEAILKRSICLKKFCKQRNYFHSAKKNGGVAFNVHVIKDVNNDHKNHQVIPIIGIPNRTNYDNFSKI